jgi:hypothetical protein
MISRKWLPGVSSAYTGVCWQHARKEISTELEFILEDDMTKRNTDQMGFAQRKRDDKPNGILFAKDGTRTLWLNNEQIAQGILPEKITLRGYFYDLRFLDDFPQITHWAFGDAWTQKILLKKPRQMHTELVGNLLFGSEDDLGTYIIERSYEDMLKRAPLVQTPLPTLFNVPLNLPLRIVIAKMVLTALDDDLPYEQWHFVTSLLPREEVAKIFTEDMSGTHGFRIKGVANNLRQALCELQGIR